MGINTEQAEDDNESVATEDASFGSSNAPIGSPRVHWSASIASSSNSSGEEEVESDDEQSHYHTIWTDPDVNIDQPSYRMTWYVVTKGRKIGVYDNW